MVDNNKNIDAIINNYIIPEQKSGTKYSFWKKYFQQIKTAKKKVALGKSQGKIISENLSP